jgi:hypothetical protein
MATKLYNGRAGLTPIEVMNWLGHKDFSSTQHYLELTPTKLMRAFHQTSKLSENLRFVNVLVDKERVAGQPGIYYDLGHGWCSNDAYAACAHRMACAKCDFYVPAASSQSALLQQRDRYTRMLQELTLTEEERQAVEGDAAAVKRLLEQVKSGAPPNLDALVMKGERSR